MTDTDRQDGDGLLHCPFCKTNSIGTEHDNSIFAGQTYPGYSKSEGWKIRCDGCGNQTAWWHTEADARKAWNTRPGATPVGEDTPYWRTLRAALVLPVEEQYAIAKDLAANCGYELTGDAYAAPAQPAPDAMRSPPILESELRLIGYALDRGQHPSQHLKRTRGAQIAACRGGCFRRLKFMTPRLARTSCGASNANHYLTIQTPGGRPRQMRGAPP